MCVSSFGGLREAKCPLEETPWDVIKAFTFLLDFSCCSNTDKAVGPTDKSIYVVIVYTVSVNCFLTTASLPARWSSSKCESFCAV